MADVGQNNTQAEIATESSPLSPTKRVVLLTQEQFQGHLARLAEASGSNAELGRRLGVTGQFVDYLIAGKRKPGKKLCAAIGARRKLMFEIDVEAE